MVKILEALPILNSSGATEKVAALVARATCSGASHSSANEDQFPFTFEFYFYMHFRGGLGFKSPGSILTSRTETSSLSRVVRDGWDPCSVPVSG